MRWDHECLTSARTAAYQRGNAFTFGKCHASIPVEALTWMLQAQILKQLHPIFLPRSIEGFSRGSVPVEG